jgi:hypothetical protein
LGRLTFFSASPLGWMSPSGIAQATVLYDFRCFFFFFGRQEDDDDLQKRKDHDEGLHSLMTTFTKDYDIEFNNEFLDEQDYNSTALT